MKSVKHDIEEGPLPDISLYVARPVRDLVEATVRGENWSRNRTNAAADVWRQLWSHLLQEEIE